MKKRIFWLCLILLSVVNFVSAANIEVKGTVVDDVDEPIIGASVIIKGTSQGVTTDVNGDFRFASLPDNSILVFSYVGMKPQEIKAAPTMHVKLEPSHEQLETVIVTAFGTAKKSAFTGSASVLDAAKIEQKQVTNVMQSLIGEVPGLEMSPSTAPGSTSSITIRGEGSINADTEPLIVVDGMPFEGNINNINPSDVENITVLKDAASSALYGARGANGVILITTKKGAAGSSLVNFDAKWGVNSRGVGDYDRITNPGEYYEAHYKALYNSYIYNGMIPAVAHAQANTVLTGPGTNGGLGYNVYSVPEGEYLIGSNGKLNPNATLGNHVMVNGVVYTLYPDNWTDEAYRHGFRQEYNFSVSGAGDKYSVYTSFGYLDEEGIVKSSDYERYSGRLRASFSPTSWFQIGSSAAYSHSTNNYSYSLEGNSSYVTGGGVFTDAANIAPIYPLYVRDANGNVMYDTNGVVYDWGDCFYNTYDRPSLSNANSLQSIQLDYYRTISNSVNADMYGDITLPYGFKATVKAGVSSATSRIKSAYNPYYGYVSQGGSLSVGSYETTTFNFQQLLNWNHDYGKNHLQALVGHESYNYNYYSLNATKTGAVDYASLTELNGFLSYPVAPTSYHTRYNTEGYIARVMYDFDERYFGQASYRRDASSRFHPDHRWGNFWSLGGAWIISREDFFNSKTINNLKLKASYGQVGNDKIGYYRYSDTYMINNVNGEYSLSFYNRGNEDITWETINNLNTGVEFDLFDYRLGGQVEYYYKKSSDMLLWFSTPSSMGFSGYYKNIGDMRNTGVDVTLYATPVRMKKFEWNVNLNFNYNNQRVTYLPQTNKPTTAEGHGGFQTGNYYFIGEGLPLYTLYIAEYAGPAEDGRSQWYTAADKDGNRSLTTDYNQAGYILVNPDQPIKGGFSTSFKLYGFDATAQFTYALGGKGIDDHYASLMSSPMGSSVGVTYHKDIYDSWSPENPDSNIPRFCYGDSYTGIASTRFVTSLSYLAFQNFQVGYTLPAKLVRKAYLTKVRVYVNGDNICLWSKRQGFDPRMSTGNGSYSPMRTISGGITIQF